MTRGHACPTPRLAFSDGDVAAVTRIFTLGHATLLGSTRSVCNVLPSLNPLPCPSGWLGPAKH